MPVFDANAEIRWEREGLGLSSDDDTIALFSTDTEDGRFCAEVNKRILEGTGWCQVLPPVVITGLKTKRTEENEDISKSFKEAELKRLKEEVEKLLNDKSYEQKYFNITGGFKATIPFTTILGKFYPRIVVFFSSAALLIGIFIQIFWQKETITEPL